ncbi:MAG: hypothetical protein GKR88_09400 [Flavobacteriaceae bacterium]|nr:MAG: hypothetical protein GKR88_09400 [Flavobacteriaceae bacterium]
MFQLTGRYNYRQFTTYYQNRYGSTLDFTTNPGLVASDKEITVISTLWFYKNNVLDKLNPAMSSSTSVAKVTKLVNGDETKGASHRKNLFNKAKDSIQCN